MKRLSDLQLDMIESRMFASDTDFVTRSEAQQMINEIRESRKIHCECCGKVVDGKIQDRHGDYWCEWCHQNGICSLEDGHEEEPPPCGHDQGAYSA